MKNRRKCSVKYAFILLFSLSFAFSNNTVTTALHVQQKGNPLSSLFPMISSVAGQWP